jgi:hypothetical protein
VSLRHKPIKKHNKKQQPLQFKQLPKTMRRKQQTTQKIYNKKRRRYKLSVIYGFTQTVAAYGTFLIISQLTSNYLNYRIIGSMLLSWIGLAAVYKRRGSKKERWYPVICSFLGPFILIYGAAQYPIQWVEDLLKKPF